MPLLGKALTLNGRERPWCERMVGEGGLLVQHGMLLWYLSCTDMTADGEEPTGTMP